MDVHTGERNRVRDGSDCGLISFFPSGTMGVWELSLSNRPSAEGRVNAESRNAHRCYLCEAAFSPISLPIRSSTTQMGKIMPLPWVHWFDFSYCSYCLF